jgi:anti-sigma B factor antagonist
MAEARTGQLQIAIARQGTVIIVTPTGDIDLNASPTLRAELRKIATEPGDRLVVNLGGVPYMDSSGVATLVEALQACHKNRKKMVICGLTPRVHSIFGIARLETVFLIVPTLDQALSA